MTSVNEREPFVPLSGGMMLVAALILASANFLAVLNLTIANVAVPNIAGGLAAAASQGTWVITSYAVGEAITVPLTGWLAGRFGSVRVFACSMILFGVFSALCGLSTSLGMLVVARIFQGLCGGPLMPLSQTLLLRIFPKQKASAAIAIWSMTTMIAPVVGPILGGYLCDNYSWRWVFFVNVPFGIGFGMYAWRLLKRYQEAAIRNHIDIIGLGLLVVWIVALQLVLDEGKNLDWFASHEIIMLSIVAVVSFSVFMIWEFNVRNPIVDMRVFRHRGFTVSVMTITFTYGAFFAVSVLIPLWLQSFMGYTATEAGKVTAWLGLSGFLIAPLVAKLADKHDQRMLVFGGVVWMGLMTMWRAYSTTDMAFWDIALPLLLMGFAMPFFFIPTTTLALSAVEPHEMDSGAGIMNFLRTMAGAVATSLVSSSWGNHNTRNHAELVGLVDPSGSMANALQQSGASPESVKGTIDYLVTSQSAMIGTNQVMAALGIIFIFAAAIIWLAPKPERVIEPGVGH